MIPDGIWCSTNSPAPVSTVWPALAPPWYRTTRSARSASTSTILPLPSSPHWAPTTTTQCVFGPNMTPQQKRPGGAGRWSILRRNLSRRHEPRHPFPVGRDDGGERRPDGPAVQPHGVHRGLHAARPELPHDLAVERDQPLLEPAGALAVAGAEGGEDLGAQRRGEAGDGEDAAVAAELERRVQERSRADEHGPRRGRVAIGGEVLRVARGILHADDVRMGGELLQQPGGDRQMRVLRDVVDEHWDGARVRHGAEVVAEARGRDAGGKIAGGPYQHGVRPLDSGGPRQHHRLARGLGPRADQQPALVRQ